MNKKTISLYFGRTPSFSGNFSNALCVNGEFPWRSHVLSRTRFSEVVQYVYGHDASFFSVCVKRSAFVDKMGRFDYVATEDAECQNLLNQEQKILNKLLFLSGEGRDYILFPLWQGVSREFFMVYRFYPQGDLMKYKDNLSDFIPDNQCFSIARQFSQGLAFLHKHDIAHLDVKNKNALVRLLPNDNIQIKITDFGLSRQCGKNDVLYCFESLGTFGYQAPEITSTIKTEDNLPLQYLGKRRYSQKSDVFALAVTLYFLKFTKYFSSSLMPDRIREMTTVLRRAVGCCLNPFLKKYYSIIQNVLISDYGDRPTMFDLEFLFASLEARFELHQKDPLKKGQ